MADHQITQQISIKLQGANGRIITVKDTAPITLGGDRRRWPKQIEDQLAKQAAAIGKMIGDRLVGDDR